MFDTEAALTLQKLYGEMISWRDRYDTFMDYFARRFLPFNFVSLWLLVLFLKIFCIFFSGPCRAGF